MSVSKNKRAVMAQLKKEWREGAKWCAFKDVERIAVDEIKCFQSYPQAAKFCDTENKNYDGLTYRVSIITDLLEGIQAYAIKGKQTAPEEIAKATLCEKYAPLSFPLYTDHLPTVPADAYFPVIWSRIINPLSDISEWIVRSGSRPNTIVFNRKDYCRVLDYFMKRCSLVGMANSREELKLQARIRDAAFGRYLELYRFYYHTKRACYILSKRIDGSKPFLLPVTYFAKYNQRLKRLAFFDENLKQVAAGKIIGEMDVKYFCHIS